MLSRNHGHFPYRFDHCQLILCAQHIAIIPMVKNGRMIVINPDISCPIINLPNIAFNVDHAWTLCIRHNAGNKIY